jgi:hypothetical protein
MYTNRSSTITDFGRDQSSNSTYTFNSLGYRSNIEFDPKHSAVVILGNTISFGLGVNVDETFAGILSNALSVPVYNFAWGCYGHTNHEQLALLQDILKVTAPHKVIFQINNLNRRRLPDGSIDRANTTEFIKSAYTEFYQQVNDLLTNTPHAFLHWDNEIHEFEHTNCLVYNKYHVDKSIPDINTSFGPKSHKLIALKLLQNII